MTVLHAETEGQGRVEEGRKDKEGEEGKTGELQLKETRGKLKVQKGAGRNSGGSERRRARRDEGERKDG